MCEVETLVTTCISQGLRVWVGSEPTPSESLVTSDDELVRAKAVTSGGVETSSQSTPPPLPGGNDTTPFSADNLGDTVVRLDKVCMLHVLMCLLACVQYTTTYTKQITDHIGCTH